ncbi:enoyl-CoA hydratase/isomerase family protein [Sporosarcina sp. FSL W7-1349]|uniref:enoyl-CoA hydratase/isomerase family protein n=1 Tax=Sporosarcina sp. FSL W7-1349 TaxID=2921561 RepID=UPI0030F78C8B
MEKKIILTVNTPYATITMNHPATMNAVTNEFAVQFLQALDEIEASPEIRAVILTGSGKNFCSGADLAFIQNEDLSDIHENVAFMERLQQMVLRMEALKLPIIAAVDGYCVGGGFSLALAADYMIATRNAKFSMIFTKVGLVPDLGSFYFLPKIVGRAKAKQLIYTAEVIDAEEAYRIGIIGKLVESENLIETAISDAQLIASRAPKAVELAKRTLNDSSAIDLESLLFKEALLQASLFLTDDFKEAIQAFVEKRSLSL